MVNINFNLDVTFRDGVDSKNKKKYLRREKKKILKDLNPRPTAIYAWFRIGQYSFKVHTGRKIEPQYWDFYAKRVEKTSPGHIEINSALQKICATTPKEYEKQIERNPDLTLEQIKKIAQQIVDSTLYNNSPIFKPQETPKKEFLDAYEEFLQIKQKMYFPATIRKYCSIRSILIHFRDTEGVCLTFDNIDSRFEEMFAGYLSERGLVDNTISKYFDCIKSFMNWARRMKYHKNLEFMDFKLVKENIPEAVALSLQEVNRIYSIDLSYSKRLDKVRDMFYFQCLTGQRFSDILNLKWLDLKESNGELIWNLTQIKGGKQVFIPIVRTNRELLLKYSGQKTSELDFVFPRITGVKMNKYLKEVCQSAGICEMTEISKRKSGGKHSVTGEKWKFISTHTARRSFVTISSYEMNIPEKAIGQITGHGNRAMIDRYTKLNNAQVMDSYRNQWGKL